MVGVAATAQGGAPRSSGEPTASKPTPNRFSAILDRETRDPVTVPDRTVSAGPPHTAAAAGAPNGEIVSDGKAPAVAAPATSLPRSGTTERIERLATVAGVKGGQTAPATPAVDGGEDGDETAPTGTVDPVQQLIASLSFVALERSAFARPAEDTPSKDIADTAVKATRGKTSAPEARVSEGVTDGGLRSPDLPSAAMGPDAATTLALPAGSPELKNRSSVSADNALSSMLTSMMPMTPAASSAGGSVGAQLLNAVALANGADQQWLDGVANDIARSSQNGDIRFRLQPADLGSISVSVAHDGAASHLTISVAEPRALSIVAQAHDQLMNGARALGVPISGASVLLDKPSADRRGAGDHARRRIEVAPLDSTVACVGLDPNRYA